MRRAALLFSLLATVPLIGAAEPIAHVTRHGRRAELPAQHPNAKDPSLSESGRAAVERLDALLAQVPLNAIYVTEYRRTQETAASLAKRNGIVPIIVPARDHDALMKRLAMHGPDEHVLVVGHSNTVPAILKSLGVKAAVSLAETDYDDLFIAVPAAPPAAVVMIRLRY